MSAKLLFGVCLFGALDLSLRFVLFVLAVLAGFHLSCCIDQSVDLDRSIDQHIGSMNA